MWLSRCLALGLGTVLAVSLSAAPAPADPELTVTALAWSQSQVDATTGTATDTLTFTVRNFVPTNALGGRVVIAARAASGFAALDYGVTFGEFSGTPRPNDAQATLVSTSGADTTYRYAFPVPRFAASTGVTWAVESIVATVSPSDATTMADADLTAAGFHDDFAATTLIDSTQPGFDSVTVTSPLSIVAGQAQVSWNVHVHDADSGVARVRLVLAGPGGRTFQATTTADLKPGTTQPADGVLVAGPVVFEAGVDAGGWTVQEVDVTDGAGNVGTFTGLSLAPLTVTADTTITATGFALSPNPVNAWTSDQTVDLTASVTTPAPITSVALDADSGCTAGTPSQSGPGTVTVPITIAAGTPGCRLKGIALTDSAGDVSAYGTDFPSTRVALPSVTEQTGPAPVVNGIQLDTATLTWASGGTVTAQVSVGSWAPGVTKLQLFATATGSRDPIQGAVVTANRVENGVVPVPLVVPPHAQLGTYRVTATLTDASGATATGTGPLPPSFTVLGTNGVSAFVPMSQPVRVLDTRGWDTLGPGGAIDVGFVTNAPVTVPANATAVVVNVTAIKPTAATFLTVWPSGKARPSVSNLNVTPGQTVANLVTVPIGAKSLISIYNHVGSVDVVVDLFGYYVPDGGADFVPVTPKRVLDTRNGVGVSPGQVTAGHPIDAAVPVPATADVAVLNVTVTNATEGGDVSVRQPGSPAGTSNLNFARGQTVANLVVVPLDPETHEFEVTNGFGGVDVLADLVGYYDSDQIAATDPMVFVPANPARILDTRNGIGAPRAALGAGGQVAIPVATAPGAPAGTEGAVLNVTAVGGTADSYLTTWPDGTARPGTSTVDFTPGQTVPNLDMAATGPDGRVAVWNHVGSVQVLADVFGYLVAG